MTLKIGITSGGAIGVQSIKQISVYIYIFSFVI